MGVKTTQNDGQRPGEPVIIFSIPGRRGTANGEPVFGARNIRSGESKGEEHSHGQIWQFRAKLMCGQVMKHG
ncbi:MAG TPA: hypothetical protein VNU93_02855, partial [Verrucomicrobiae bacterium]|nr:hypothetical protein [Verrucomicrobiae bacterium]